MSYTKFEFVEDEEGINDQLVCNFSRWKVHARKLYTFYQLKSIFTPFMFSSALFPNSFFITSSTARFHFIHTHTHPAKFRYFASSDADHFNGSVVDAWWCSMSWPSFLLSFTVPSFAPSPNFMPCRDVDVFDVISFFFNNCWVRCYLIVVAVVYCDVWCWCCCCYCWWIILLDNSLKKFTYSI